MTALPTGPDVLAFLGWPADADLVEQATRHVTYAASIVAAYTRGSGFSDDGVEDGLGQVIVSAAARSLTNPSAAKRVEAGSYNSVPGSFHGFTLAELAVLNGYRVRVA